MRVKLHKFLSSSSDVGEWSASLSGSFVPWDSCNPLTRKLGGFDSRYGPSSREDSPYFYQDDECLEAGLTVSSEVLENSRDSKWECVLQFLVSKYVLWNYVSVTAHGIYFLQTKIY